MDTPPLILLSGIPGAGKSTVARTLLRHFARGLHIAVDDLRELVVSGIAHPLPEWTDETTRQFRLARDSAAAMARLYAGAGFAVVIDDVIGPADAEAHFASLADEHRLHKIVLQPDLATTLARNAARAGKPFDTALLTATIERLHLASQGEPYADYGWNVIDTSGQTPEQTAEALLALLARPALPVDRRGVLDEQVFSYRAARDKVLISWYGKQVTVLRGEQARKFLRKIDGLEGKDAQLIMAKATGNFKRGNER